MQLHKYARIVATIAILLSTTLMAGEAESFTVKGLRVIFKQNTASEIVATQIIFRGGATMLTPGQAGIENLALLIARKATRNYSKEVLSGALESMNTQITPIIFYDYSGLGMRSVSQHFDESWELFTDMFLNPLFDEEDVELERQKQISFVRQNRDDPDTYLGDLVTEVFYANHPYAINVHGTEETLEKFTAEELSGWIKGRLETRQMLLIVVGNVDKNQLKNKVKKFVKRLPKGRYRASYPPPVSHAKPSFKIVDRDLPTNYIRGQFPVPAFGSPESYIMALAIPIMRNRVWEEVRTKRGLSYAPSVRISNRISNYGFLYVTAVSPDTTIKVMAEVVRGMQAEPVPAKLIRDKLNETYTRYYLGIETNSLQASLLARYELSGVGIAEEAKYMEYLRQVTPEDIQRVCQKYIRNLQFVLLGNPGEVREENFLF